MQQDTKASFSECARKREGIGSTKEAQGLYRAANGNTPEISWAEPSGLCLLKRESIAFKGKVSLEYFGR